MRQSPEEAKKGASAFSRFVIISSQDGIRGQLATVGCSLKRGIYFLMDAGDYAGSTAMDFDRLLSRTSSVVNSPPQTLQRQPGEEIPGISVRC